MLQHHMPFLTALLLCLSIYYFPYYISKHMKFEVVLLTGRIFETIFFCVTSYSFSIDQSFIDNTFLSSTNDDAFDWYSNCGGKNSV